MKENKIQLLSEREHVLTVPARYIGSIAQTAKNEYILEKNGTILKKDITFVPAFITLFREVLSNSVDENIRTNGKFANRIDVSIKNNFIIVRDNGRGLPHIKEEKTGLPQSVIAFTRLKAGTNFTEKTTAIGQNGEGVSLVNIFSKEFVVNTSDGIKKTSLKCKDNLSKQDYKLTKNKQKYTEIKYLIDFERLNMIDIDETHYKLIEKIVLDMSVCYPNIKFTFNKKVLPIKTFKDYIKLYNFEMPEIFNYENIDIAIISNNDFEQISWVNGIYTRRGGTHIDHIQNNVTKEFRSLIEKKFRDIKPADIYNKLCFMVNVRNMIAPRFDSQTKEELIGGKVELDDIDFKSIAQKLKKNKIINENILETFKIREELKKRKELKNKEKQIKNISVSGFIDANHKNRDECVLYIAEGKSALANFIECRDPKFAGFPLRGKIMNVAGEDKLKIAKSKKVAELCKVLGLKISSKSIDNLRYGKIVFLTDADYDGDSIMCLLVNMFYEFWPSLLTEGKVFKSMSPLISATNINTKEKKYFYDVNSFREENKDNEWKVNNYNKGLGSLTLEEYNFSLTNLVQIVMDEESENLLNIAFGKDSNPRKEWMIER